MPEVINPIFTKDFPPLGRDLLDTDIIVIAVAGNPITYISTVGALRTAIGGIPVAGNFDSDGNFDASLYGIPDSPIFQVYQGGVSVSASFDNTSQIISGGTPGAFTAKFI